MAMAQDFDWEGEFTDGDTLDPNKLEQMLAIKNHAANGNIGKQPPMNPLTIPLDDTEAPGMLDIISNMIGETNAGQDPIPVTPAALTPNVPDPGIATKPPVPQEVPNTAPGVPGPPSDLVNTKNDRFPPAASAPPIPMPNAPIQTPAVDAGDNVDLLGTDPYAIMKQFMVDQEASQNRNSPLEESSGGFMDMIMKALMSRG